MFYDFKYVPYEKDLDQERNLKKLPMMDSLSWIKLKKGEHVIVLFEAETDEVYEYVISTYTHQCGYIRKEV
jgi:hypothetical protein